MPMLCLCCGKVVLKVRAASPSDCSAHSPSSKGDCSLKASKEGDAVWDCAGFCLVEVRLTRFGFPEGNSRESS